MNVPAFRFIPPWMTVFGLCLALCMSWKAYAVEAPAKLQTLRGVDVMSSEPLGDGARLAPDSSVLPRDFVQQPPLIPHTIEGYLVSKEFNKCMDCHAWSRSKEAKATKISITHFKSREGAEMSSVSPQRYFCNQCHVSQTDSKPLVGNTFKPGAGLR